MKKQYVKELIAQKKSYHIMVAMVINKFEVTYDDAYELVNDLI